MTLSRTEEIRQVASEWEFDKRIAETAPKVFDVSAINEKPPTPEDLESTERIASEQMADAQKRHAGETHSDHCWARLAWGDGECECGHRRCVECGRALTADMAEERPYVALPGDVVAYSTHCKGGCEGSSELATQRAGWSPT